MLNAGVYFDKTNLGDISKSRKAFLRDLNIPLATTAAEAC